MKNQVQQNNTTIEQVRERIDEYKGTIHALQAFVSLTTWDNTKRQKRPDAVYSFGRRMNTSSKNLVSPNNEVTPDTVIQLSNETGYVVEAKYSLPMEIEHWEHDFSQLLKYDDDLNGWWTNDEKIESFNNVMLIHYSRSVRFVEALNEWLQKKQIRLSPASAIIEFTKDANANEYYTLRLAWGSIKDDELKNRLRYSVPIPIEKVVGTYGSKKFYDSEPMAIEFTMATIWNDYVNERADRTQYNKKLGGVPVYINLDQLTSEFQKLYGQTSNGPRDVVFPLKSWIQNAMEEFVNIKLARRLDDNPEGYDYLVIFRHINTELLEYFVDSRNKAKKTDSAKQLRLFSNNLAT